MITSRLTLCRHLETSADYCRLPAATLLPARPVYLYLTHLKVAAPATPETRSELKHDRHVRSEEDCLQVKGGDY